MSVKIVRKDGTVVAILDDTESQPIEPCKCKNCPYCQLLKEKKVNAV